MRLTNRMKVVLGEIVFGDYRGTPEDTRTIRSLIKRKLIVRRRQGQHGWIVPARFDATLAGRQAMTVKR